MRFDIEEAFLDDPSNGWNRQKSEIRGLCALSRLWFLLAVATLYVTAQGVEVVAAGAATLRALSSKPFDDWPHQRVDRFMADLAKHRHRMVNYNYYQAEGISIGSGEIELTVKQIGRRMKISGAQWDENHVQQVLHQRCAYLNGYFSR